VGAGVGQETDIVSFLDALASEPHRYDFYQVMRRLECAHPELPRWGMALRPRDEPVRLGQDPELTFAPAPLSTFTLGSDGRHARLAVRLFGLLGPNGPLPLHLTEYARERQLHAGDRTLARFLDMLSHRFVAFFYRAWAQSQPTVAADRAGDDRFHTFIGALIGIAPAAFRSRDSVPDEAKLAAAGLLAPQVRNADGLRSILAAYFHVPVRLREFIGHWLDLARSDQTTLAATHARLGQGAVLGRQVYDRQCRFRIELGPLSRAVYESFLPTGELLRPLVDWVRSYVGFEYAWDLRLALTAEEVPVVMLGETGRLGWTSWLGLRPLSTPADDLVLEAEAALARAGSLR
jgi:type VI secretion system protein ImpH